MAAKYLHSLADENPDLQKQIGCMKGVFQIFNRQHIVSRRRVFSHSLKGGDTGGLESGVMGQRRLNVEKHRLSTESSKDLNASRSLSRQNLDLRDVVKDSMHREARGLSHNIETKNEPNDWCHDEPRELSRSKSCQFRDRVPSSICKDYPRFSYDGRENDSRTTKLKQMKELPRLSLDNRERSIHTPSLVPIQPSNSKRNYSRDPKNNAAVDAGKDLSQTRASGVVAKLMGLETFPSLKSSNDGGAVNKTIKSTSSSFKEPISPSRKIPDLRSITKVTIEPAPWKQRDGTRLIRSSMHSPVSSVYGDVDKRLKNLEFAESGKDLRALKHVLEAMQVVETRKEEKQDHQNPPCASEESDVSRGQESHIVIMKPAKLVKKGPTNNKLGKDLITDSTRGERRSRPSMPLTDASKPRKHSNKQRSESRSPNRRKKPSNFQKSDDQNRETQMLSECSEESNSRQSSSTTPEKTSLHVKTSEPITPEYPSPVSVLDDSVHVDNSPSPVKRTLIAKKDDATEKIVKDRYEATNVGQSSTAISTVKFHTNHEKLKKVENLIQKLKNLDCSHNEPHTDHIASLCENTNPNDRYISEIFLASGLLLRDLQSFNPHPSGHPINPKLFLVLEHTKYSNLQSEKLHRKLIFDAVNEILVGKLSSVSEMIMQSPRKLLRELCLEIEQLQVHTKRDMCLLEYEDDVNSILGEDVLKRSGNWTGYFGESAVIAMEVEWLILLELVDEVVMSQAYEEKQGKASRFC